MSEVCKGRGRQTDRQREKDTHRLAGEETDTLRETQRRLAGVGRGRGDRQTDRQTDRD